MTLGPRDRPDSEKLLTFSVASSPSSSASESPSDQVASRATELGRDPQTADVSSAGTCWPHREILIGHISEMILNSNDVGKFSAHSQAEDIVDHVIRFLHKEQLREDAHERSEERRVGK